MPPNKEPLLIMVGGLDATYHIPVDSIRIINERGYKVGTCSFTLEDGATFSVSKWTMVVIIHRTNQYPVYFQGYITQFSSKKRGVKIDYDIDCDSQEVRLQKAIIDGDYSGTDLELLALLLTESTPDLSSLFDFSTLVDGLSASDLDVDWNNLNTLDALQALAGRVDAYYDFEPNTGTQRINWNFNPALTNGMTHYSGTIDANSNLLAGGWAAYAGAGVAWGSASGETTGGIAINADFDAGTYYWAYLNIGNITLPDYYFSRSEDSYHWLHLVFRTKHNLAATTLTWVAEMLVYDENGTFVYYQDAVTDPGNGDFTNAWGTVDFIFDISWDEVNLPAVFAVVFIIRTQHTLDYIANIDSVMVERVYNATAPFAPATYFDGTTAAAIWLGPPHNSPSMLNGEQMLRWDDTPAAADYDLDIGNMGEIVENLDWQFNAIDNINTTIVTGGFVYDDVDWIYPGDGTLTHFDVETEIYPVDGATMPTVYLNAGTDNEPVWQPQAIGSYDELEGIFSGVVVLYQQESHWFYWQTAPSQLEKSWRVVGRIKRRLRATVSDDANIAATGVELADTITDDSITSEDEAFAIGKTELANRDGTSTFEFDTYQPGLIPGRLLTLVDTSRDIDHTAIIQRVERTYIGGGYAKFHITAGQDPDDLADVIAAIDSKATAALMPPRTRAIDTPISETLRQLWDDDSADLVDDDFAYLFDIAP